MMPLKARLSEAATAPEPGPAVYRRPNNATKLALSPACHDLHVITSAGPFIHVHNSSSPKSFTSPVVEQLPVKPQPAHISPERCHLIPSFNSSDVTLNQCCAPPSAKSSPKFGRMGLSKEQRIGILLGIDGIFFLIELSVGTSTTSSR
jgi:hypothetical protein